MNKLFNRLSKSQLETKKAFIENYKHSENAADGSPFDANANVSSKNVATLMGELHKDENIQLKRYLISENIKELFGSAAAKEYNKQIEDHIIYVHDESAVNQPYCLAMSMYPFLLNGLKGLGGESRAPQHVDSFCGSFLNLIYAVSSQVAGAVAAVEFLLYLDYFFRKDYGNDYLADVTWLDKVLYFPAKRKEAARKKLANSLQQVVYGFGTPAASRNYQSVFVNISIFDKYFMEAMFGDFKFPDGTEPDFESLTKLQYYFMEWHNNERTKALLTFPVVTCAFLTENGKNKDTEFTKRCAELMAKGYSFFVFQDDSVSALSSCCRLRNELQKEKNAFSYTLGAGGIQTGSLNVITLNINRFVQDTKRKFDKTKKKDFTEYLQSELRTEIQKIHKFQVATKQYLRTFKDAGLMPIYTEGYINMDKQYLTIGVNGIVEAAEFLGYEINNNPEYRNFITDILSVIKDENQKARKTYKKYKVMMNTEIVPAESLGVKNYNWDKEDGYVVPSTRNCYNSYLYRVEDDLNIIDKIMLHGRENLRYLDGGSALHLNLETYPDAEAFEKLYGLTAKLGCSYWTYNVLITICEEKECGYIDKRTLDHCSKCGSRNVTYGTRIIGYLKKIDSFSAARRREASQRWYHKHLD